MSAVLTNERIEYSKILAKRLREAMARSGVGVNELARLSGIPAMTISRTINHQNMPLAGALKCMADALDVSLDSLFEEEDDGL